MKNKKLSWVLLPVVLVVWGIIGWKVYTAIVGDSGSADVPSNDSIVSEDTSFIPDSYVLLLNYRDPFLDITEVKKPKPGASAVKPPPVSDVVVAEENVWPSITYSGLVREPKSGKTVGFLVVDGVSYFVQSGDKAGVVDVVTVSRDSVKVAVGTRSVWCRR